MWSLNSFPRETMHPTGRPCWEDAVWETLHHTGESSKVLHLAMVRRFDLLTFALVLDSLCEISEKVILDEDLRLQVL